MKRHIEMMGWAVVLTCFAMIAHAGPSRVFAFGDSLSDRGNLLAVSPVQSAGFPGGPLLVPPPTRYSDGRFANGEIWLEYLVEHLNAGSDLLASETIAPGDLGSTILGTGASVSFAFGGAQTGLDDSKTPDGLFDVPGIRKQVASFGAAIGAPIAPGNALYSVFGGANDYLFLLNPAASPMEVAAVVSNVVTNISLSIQDLYALGARKFLVPNLSDLGTAPLVAGIAASAGLDPAVFAASLRGVSQLHNGFLAGALAGLAGLPDIRIVELDVFSLADQALMSLDGSPGPASGCLFPPNVCTPVAFNSPTGFFWDELHPSAVVHELLGAAAITAVPTPQALGLLVIGLVGLQVSRRRCLKRRPSGTEQSMDVT